MLSRSSQIFKLVPPIESTPLNTSWLPLPSNTNEKLLSRFSSLHFIDREPERLSLPSPASPDDQLLPLSQVLSSGLISVA